MKKWAKIAGIELLTLLMILGVLEFCSWSFAPAPALATRHDSVVGARYPRSMDRLVYNRESGVPVSFRTNAVGFRGPEWKLGRQPGIQRVAILGDSFIAAEALEVEETLNHKLHQLLATQGAPGERWEVMNFGVAGSSTADQLALYRNVVRHYKPDIIVVGYGTGTDVVDNSRELASHVRVCFRLSPDGRLERDNSPAENSGWLDAVFRWSRFYAWQKSRSNQLIKEVRKGVQQPSRIDWIFDRQESEKMTRAWKLTAAILEQLDRETRRDGCTLVVMAVPCAIQVYEDSADQLAGRLSPASRVDPLYPTQRLLQICARREIPCLSMVGDFRRRAPSRLSTREEEWLFFNGVGHLNRAGQRAAAENLFQFLVREKLVSGISTTASARTDPPVQNR